MKKVLLFIIVIVGLCAGTTGYAQSWQWARSGNCSSFLSGSEGWLVKTDPSNNVYMAGFYYGDSICIGPVTYYNPINPTNNTQTLIVKYNSAGNVLWSKAGMHGESRPISITTDHKGNLYVFGYFITDSIRFDSQLLENERFDFAHPGSNACYYLLKYDEYGNLLWTDNGIGSIHPDGDYLKAGGIAADAAGDIYISSTYNVDTLTIGSIKLSNAADSSDDIFVIKYNTSGNILWAKSFGGAKNDYVLDVTSNGSKVFFTGYFKSGYLDFGGTRLYNNDMKGYVACIDINGNALWAQSAGGKGIARCVSTDKKGNAYVAGGFADTLVFDSYSLYNTNGGYFVIKYDSAGTMQAPKVLKPLEHQTSCCDVYSMTTDACNGVWLTVNMEPGKGIAIDNNTTVYPPGGSVDPTLIAGYDAEGNLIDHLTLPSGGGYNSGLSNTGLSADSRGNIFFSGDFRVIDPFVIGPDALHLDNGQQTNIFIAKYKTASACADTVMPVYPANPNIKIYPDPANDECFLSYNGDLRRGGIMTLRDITGRLINIYKMTAALTPFSVANLPAGMYMCEIKVTGRENYSLRLVIVR